MEFNLDTCLKGGMQRFKVRVVSQERKPTLRNNIRLNLFVRKYVKHYHKNCAANNFFISDLCSHVKLYGHGVGYL